MCVFTYDTPFGGRLCFFFGWRVGVFGVGVRRRDWGMATWGLLLMSFVRLSDEVIETKRC